MSLLPKKKSVKFSYSAPTAKSVAVAASFNNWSATAHPMKKGIKGHWSCSLKLAPGRYEYRFVLNGSQWMDDPACTERCPNPLGGQNCVLHV
ncbi:MAG: isoamylase early set domain-containing protein [Patescibacteria group bacterium]